MSGYDNPSPGDYDDYYNNNSGQYQDPYDYGGNINVNGGGGGPMVDSNGLPIDMNMMDHHGHHDGMNMNMNMNMNGMLNEGVVEDDGDETNTNTNDESDIVDFDNDPQIANLPRILMMGPRRAGKTSIQRVVFHKMSPHETLFRLEATQTLERSVVDHTPLCRFTIWDFPGDYYGPENGNENVSSNSVGGVGNGPTAGGGMGVGDNNVDAHYHHHDTMNGMSSQQQQQLHQQQDQQQQQQQSRMMRQPPVHANSMNNNHNDNSNNSTDQYSHHQSQQQQQQQQLQLQQQQQQQQQEGLPSTITTTPPTENNQTNNNEDEGDAYVFGRATALIFVLDAQDEPYDHVLQHFTETVKRAARANPHIAIEVFINKVDGELFLSDEAKYDCRRDVMQQVTDELADAGVMPDSVPISYHLTSIYDHSVFEAFSRVVQKLIPQLPTLENLLNVLVSTCAMEKAYLFDVASKLYISTDSSPVDMQSVELCSDMIDCVLDVSGIYGLAAGKEEDDDDDVDNQGPDGVINGNDNDIDDSSTAPPGSEPVSLNSSDPAYMMKNVDGGKVNVNDNVESTGVNGINNMNAMGGGVGGVGDDFAIGNDIGALDYDNDGNDELVGTLISQSAGAIVENEGGKEKEVDADSAYDSESASVIRLSKGMVLYLKEVDTMLALVCLTRADNFRKRNLINYNIGCLKKALRALVKTDK